MITIIDTSIKMMSVKRKPLQWSEIMPGFDFLNSVVPARQYLHCFPSKDSGCD